MSPIDGRRHPKGNSWGKSWVDDDQKQSPPGGGHGSNDAGGCLIGFVCLALSWAW